MGKDAANKSKQIAGEAANNFGSLATNLSGGSGALKTAQDYYGSIIKGGPQAYSVIAPQVDFAKQQFLNARRNLTQTVPAGGQVPANMTALAQGEAQTISGLYREGIEKALQDLSSVGATETQGALGAAQGQTGVSAQLAQLAAQQLGAWVSGVSGLAGGMGTLFGNVFKAPSTVVNTAHA